MCGTTGEDTTRMRPNEKRLSCAATLWYSQMQFYYDGRRQLQPLVRQQPYVIIVRLFEITLQDVPCFSSSYSCSTAKGRYILSRLVRTV